MIQSYNYTIQQATLNWFRWHISYGTYVYGWLTCIKIGEKNKKRKKKKNAKIDSYNNSENRLSYLIRWFLDSVSDSGISSIIVAEDWLFYCVLKQLNGYLMKMEYENLNFTLSPGELCSINIITWSDTFVRIPNS